MLIAATLVTVTDPASAREHRSREVAREYRGSILAHLHGERPVPAPAMSGIISSRLPDAVQNLQWQTVSEAQAKDRWGRTACDR